FCRFYCDYCDTYLTHDSPSVRKTHCSGRKHKENVKDYYQKWMEEQAQSLIDKTISQLRCSFYYSYPEPECSFTKLTLLSTNADLNSELKINKSMSFAKRRIFIKT
uniref:Small nuclear ribonucleoprotein polypeptide C n=1 Tax=Nothobranchius furzeri TaxID=105023 RepID=A0A8C6LTD1_NOTFU